MNHLYFFVDISWFAFVVVDYFVYVELPVFGLRLVGGGSGGGEGGARQGAKISKIGAQI